MLKKFSVGGWVESDYSVSSLSEKESRERERELDNKVEHLLDRIQILHFYVLKLIRKILKFRGMDGLRSKTTFHFG